MARMRAIALVALTVASAISLSGCKGDKPVRVSSAWPVAMVERQVPRPPQPPRWPLTGLIAPNATVVKRRAISVKIENSPQARPQTGLQDADVVYEEITEGGITRFNSIFQSKIPKEVGPVRSARLPDLWIVPQYHALFFFAGANTQVNRAIRNAGLPNLSEDVGVTYPYYRSSARYAPHNLYLMVPRAYTEASRRKMSTTGPPKPLEFLKRTKPETVTVTSIYVPFSPANNVLWTYDRKAAAYRRMNNGKRFTDPKGKQLTAKNVVVMWAKHIPKGESKWGSEMYDILLGGSGRAVVFRNGVSFSGTWIADRKTPPRFKDANGRAVLLAPGNTWIQVVAPGTNITIR